MKIDPIRNNLANGLTLLNGVAGLALIYGLLTIGDHMTAVRFSFYLIAVGVILDTIDGPCARLLKANSPMGAQLDSLADASTFGFATACLILYSALDTYRIAGLVTAALWLVAVLWRLARFNLETDTQTAHFYFRGMCSPVASLYVAAALTLTTSRGLPVLYGLIFSLLLSALMVSPLKFDDLPKHYLAGKRPPWDILLAVILGLVTSVAAAVFAFFSFFLAQSLLKHITGASRQA